MAISKSMTKADAAVIAWFKTCGNQQAASLEYQKYTGENYSGIPADCVVLANRFAEIWKTAPTDFYSLMDKIPTNLNSGPLSDTRIVDSLKSFLAEKGIDISTFKEGNLFGSIMDNLYTPESTGSTKTITTPQTSNMKIVGIVGLVGISIVAVVLVIFMLKK